MTRTPRVRAEQQGDGQPENVRELEDPGSGAALAGDGTPAAPSKHGGADAPPPRAAGADDTAGPVDPARGDGGHR